MNHFVYNTLSALSYHISRKSFLVVKKWRDQELFWLIICLEQLESVEVKNSDHLSLSRTLNKK